MCTNIGLCPLAASTSSVTRRLLAYSSDNLLTSSTVGDAHTPRTPSPLHALREALRGVNGVTGVLAWDAAAAELRTKYGGYTTGDSMGDMHASGPPKAAGRLGDALRGLLTGAGDAKRNSGDNSLMCDFCNAAVEYVKVALHNNQTVEQIEEVGLGGSGARACVHALVRAYMHWCVRTCMCEPCMYVLVCNCA